MENKSENEVMSTQKSLQANHDPGWNDPPKWAFTPTPNSGSTPTKRLLNKRVAFPMNSTSSSSNSPQTTTIPASANLPPLPTQTTSLTTAPHAPLIAPSRLIPDVPVAESLIDDEKTLNSILEILQTMISTEFDDNSKNEEIQKRLNIMSTMWRDNKLNRDIQGKVFNIAEALQCKDIDTADKIHVTLMMNHAATCNTWIPAIRHIILMLREKNVANEAEVTGKSEPLL